MTKDGPNNLQCGRLLQKPILSQHTLELSDTKVDIYPGDMGSLSPGECHE